MNIPGNSEELLHSVSVTTSHTFHIIREWPCGLAACEGGVKALDKHFNHTSLRRHRMEELFQGSWLSLLGS